MTDADERIQRWLWTLDPMVMWPETSAEERRTAYEAIFQATQRVLAGQVGRIPAREDRAVRATGVAAFVSGMGALLGYWVERGLLRVEPPLAALLAEHLVQGRRRAVLMAERLARLGSAFAHRGAPLVLLKGTYTAQRYFPDPGVRPAADIDILVPGDFHAAQAALSDCGLEVRKTHTLPQREDWALPGPLPVWSVEMGHADNAWMVDIHHSLDRSYFGGLVAGLGSPPAAMVETWHGERGPLLVLAQPWLAAHLAVHASADVPHMQLIRLVELVTVLRTDVQNGRLKWRELADLLKERALLRFAYPALTVADMLAPGSVDAALLTAAAHDATPRLRRVVDRNRFTLPYHAARRSTDESLMWAKGTWQLFRNLVDLVYPTGPVVSAATRWRIWRRRLSLLLTGRVRMGRQR